MTRDMRDRPRGLPQSRKQRFFPAPVVDGPTDFSFALLLQHICPDRLIAVIGGHVQAIDYGHASCQLALRLNVDEVLAPIRSDGWIKRNRHGNWIGQRNTIFAGLHFVSLAGMAVALDGKLRERSMETQDARDVVFANYCFSSGKMPAHELDRQATVHDDASGFGIDPDVVLG